MPSGCERTLARLDHTTLCRRPLPGEHAGTYSVTSLGGVGSTFLLAWLKSLHRVFQRQASAACELANGSSCACPALAARKTSLPRHLVSCHIDDDGPFKHLADPAALNAFGSAHRAVYLVGSPLSAVASVFRRRFQCWHFHRLHGCWFARSERDGRIACDAPAVTSLRRTHGAEAADCRVPPYGPLSSLAAYARHGGDLFGAIEQVRSWLSCRRPRCSFDILVLRYEALNASLGTLFDFLQLPPATRALFPHARLRAARPRPRAADAMAGGGGGTAALLRGAYGPLEEAVARIPPEGLWLRNRA